MEAEPVAPASVEEGQSEHVGRGERVVKRYKTSKRTFAETASDHPMLGEDNGDVEEENCWFDTEIVVESDKEDDDPSAAGDIPVVKFSKKQREEWIKPWKNALLVKFLGKAVALPLFQQRMLRIWKPEGRSEIIDLGSGWFIARFQLQKDCLHVLVDGPWKLFNHYVVAQRWRPNFRPETAKVERMAVWTRLPGLPVEFFREEAIKEILRNVGTPLKLDTTTIGVQRGQFARAVVEIDLSKPLVAVVNVEDYPQKIEFEGLKVICFDCGEIGHRSTDCPKNQCNKDPAAPMNDTTDGVQGAMNVEQQNQPPPVEKHGEWMIVKSKRKPKNMSTNRQTTKPSKGDKGQSRTTASSGKKSANARNNNQFESLRRTGNTAVAKNPRDRNKEVLAPNKGGLLLLWNHGSVNLEIMSHSSQAIHTKAKQELGDCFITFAYVRPNLIAKSRFWDECRTVGNTLQAPWILLGDLNDIASDGEQWGSDSICSSAVQRFVDALDSCGLFELEAAGSRFTWCRHVGNRVVQMRKLDRVLWNMSAQARFPEGKSIVLPRLHSDHHPVLFLDVAGNPPDRDTRPFRFEAAWLGREDYKKLWEDTVKSFEGGLEVFIPAITEKSKLWNREVFGNIFQRKKQLEGRIRGVQQSPNFAVSGSLQALDRRLNMELNTVLDQEETLWFQKSRTSWIKDGDRNTRFYHNSAVIKRNRNRIRFLKINGSWTADPTIISRHITDFFSSLFCRSSLIGGSEIAPIENNRKLSSAQSRRLVNTVPMEEVRKAVFGMKRFGSPGPDGIPAAFYQHYWDSVGPALTQMVNQALHSGTVHKSLLVAFMCLIPKKEAPESAADFRPISLLNVAFKVISKVLVNRMRPIMCKLIGPHQNSFLPGRSTLDNIILTQEIIHTMYKKKGRKGLMAVKVDLQKAYDSVDWAFLEDTLMGFGFPKTFIDLVLYYLRESSISILWNGGTLPPFVPGRGLRQGDPLAPYLFNLVMERLAYDIQREVSRGNWKPISISRGGIGISHLFFADDLMLFGEAIERQAKVMSDCLDRLSRVSGLKVNLTKSQIFCSPNTGSGSKQNMETAMGIPVTPHLGSYLGIPLLQKRVSRDMFGSILSKMRRKLASWKANSLSMAGRRVLVQSSLSTIPTYTMQSLSLPVSTCKDIDRICRNFLWGHAEDTRKIHTVNWATICKSKEMGGLGLRLAKDFNLAFMMQLAWQMTNCADKIWVQALREKYVKSQDFLTVPPQTNASWGWKGILKGRDILRKGICWKVGTGESLNVWKDPWVGTVPLADIPGVSIPPSLLNLQVNNLIKEDKTWDLTEVQDYLPDSVTNSIRAIPIALTESPHDAISWPHSGTGSFTLKSGFNFIAGQETIEEDLSWVWHVKCTEKVKLFIWKITQNGLLTNSERSRRGLSTDAICQRCDGVDESLDHIFRRCDFALDCWANSQAPASFNATAFTPLSLWIKDNCDMMRNATNQGSWTTIFPYLLWSIWRARNDIIFNNRMVQVTETVLRAKKEASEAERLLIKHGGIMLGRQLWISWKAPSEGWCKLNTDGARKAATGLASAGGVLRDHEGAWLTGFTSKIGITSSFIAELWGLREGLKMARSWGVHWLTLEVDSEAVLNAVLGDNESRPEANTIIGDCKAFMRMFERCLITHTLREGNRCADALANLGQNSSWGTTILALPPEEIQSILSSDAHGVAIRRIY
ncbi:PREDICTED: uncharacterized protein LOC109164864 [Ipomoea nil]|uniref:uncharacterized protein LOC109164864 n=1 Tax=Ipomoea nil TaxID=35883 RepID=UPI00090107CB|nr:PREDICTED: uncharacterized protein LOC109164864 [Ipomoea nil]